MIKPFAIILSLLPVASFGQLSWTKTTASVVFPNGQTSTVVKFEYQNRTTDVIKIISATPTCGCTIMTPPASSCSPGASGFITATYHANDRTGSFKNSILVETEKQTTELVINGTVIEWLKLDSKFFMWRKDQASQLKSVRLSLRDVKGTPEITIDGATKVSAKIRATKNESATEWYVDLQPLSTSVTLNETLTLRVRRPDLDVVAEETLFVAVR